MGVGCLTLIVEKPILTVGRAIPCGRSWTVYSEKVSWAVGCIDFSLQTGCGGWPAASSSCCFYFPSVRDCSSWIVGRVGRNGGMSAFCMCTLLRRGLWTSQLALQVHIDFVLGDWIYTPQDYAESSLAPLTVCFYLVSILLKHQYDKLDRSKHSTIWAISPAWIHFWVWNWSKDWISLN